MPTNVKALIDAPGNASCAALPANVPSAAPTNNVGVNTPPTAPEPEVNTVAMTFSTRMSSTLCHNHGWCNNEFTTE